ncbi:MAG TPA: ABC transporter ATP-binding protein [Methylomirabilota bacterium]|nr:ABC transporter ATP-binding protein [Methylomirabilota bacterium]
MPPVIVAEHLTKWYGPRLAVDRVSLEVEAGEVMGLLGPNGSGKTTILRILTGYLRPSDGTARIAGLDVVDQAFEARARVGYVPEDSPLYGWMAVREFLGFMARLKGLARARVASAVDGAIERLALGDVAYLPIGKLSRGYRQRVAIAQALLGDPELLVLDEPTNGLDPRQIIEMRGHIRALAGERTVLVTSHILGEIERVADRVAILLGGRLLGVHSLRNGGLGQRLRLCVRGRPDAVRAALAGVPGVRGVSQDAGATGDLAAYVIDADAHPRVAEAAAAALVAGGLGLVEMGPAPVDLEALFLGLTGGRPGDRP